MILISIVTDLNSSNSESDDASNNGSSKLEQNSSNDQTQRKSIYDGSETTDCSEKKGSETTLGFSKATKQSIASSIERVRTLCN